MKVTGDQAFLLKIEKEDNALETTKSRRNKPEKAP